jgi:hypothetical protein
MFTLGCCPRVLSWQSRLFSTAMVGIAIVLLAAGPTLGDPARPIVNEKFSDFRRNIVRANMHAAADIALAANIPLIH